jgi:hypothetical protein
MMLEMFATAYPNSGLQNLLFSLESKLFSGHVKVSAGTFESTRVPTPTGVKVADVSFRAELSGTSVTVHGQDIPTDGTVHFVGVNKSLFVGLIYHGGTGILAPHCKFRCNPNDPFITGPGCIECTDDGLIFKICC